MSTDSKAETPGAPPPHAQLIQMGTAYWVSRIVFAAAKLGLADHLAEGPKSATELAGPTRTHAPALHRLMRTLAGLGVLAEDSNSRFTLTPLGEALKTDAPGSARATILALAGQWWWRGWEQILHSLESGGTGMHQAYGMSLFDFLSQQPEEASYFNKAMIGFHGSEPAAVAAAYDFSGFQTVVDVGGGTGNLLTAILKRHSHLNGILFDLPHVNAEASAAVNTHGLGDRVTVEAGDFFKSVPPGGDAYILSHVIHDWDEDQCLTILNNCRKAMKPGSRLLLVETVLPSGNAPHAGKILDIAMLVMPGGQERTDREYGELLSRAHFRLTRVVSTASPVAIVEGVVA